MSKDLRSEFVKKAVESIKANKAMPTELSRPLAPKPKIFSDRLNVALKHSVENLADELCAFERKFVNNNAELLWMNDFNDVFECLKRLKKEVKTSEFDLLDSFNNPLFKELGINSFFEDKKANISPKAPLQLMKADMMISETGQILLVDKDFDYIEKLHNSKTNIFITTVDRIVSSLNYAEEYSRYVRMSYASESIPQMRFTLFGSSLNCKTYLLVVDNQRSELLKQKVQRQALTCVGCGRCEIVCPIDQLIGKKPYDNVFTGPIARVMLPYLEDDYVYGHVVYACTLCGRCEDVCPVSLPLRDMILATRQDFFEHGKMDAERKQAYLKHRKYVKDRKRLNRSGWLKQKILSRNISRELRERIYQPKFADKTFNQTQGS